jgi:hypothetical protein
VGVPEDLLRIDSFMRIAFQPSHGAMLPFMQPLLEHGGMVGRGGGGEPAVIESQIAGALADLLSQCAA